jgi:PAS domain-containing protein
MGSAVRMRLRLGAAAAVLLSPGAAHAASDPALASFGAACATLAVLVIVGAVLLLLAQRRIRSLREERDRAAATLAARDAVIGAAPAALYRWDHRAGSESFAAGPIAALGALNGQRLPNILACLEPKDAAAVEAAVARLRADGTGFDLPVTIAASDAALDASGRRVVAGDGTPTADLLWLVDASGRAHAVAECAAAHALNHRLRSVLDVLPLPVWRRGADLALIDCNRAYAAAVDAAAQKALAEQREIGTGAIGEGGRALASRTRGTMTPQSESHHIVIAGSRRLMEFTEVPLDGSGELVGFAQDFTDLENIQAELARHIAAHADVLENVAVAIAIYGPDTKLTFFNTAFASPSPLD